jgi:hypothetical protein
MTPYKIRLLHPDAGGGITMPDTGAGNAGGDPAASAQTLQDMIADPKNADVLRDYVKQHLDTAQAEWQKQAAAAQAEAARVASLSEKERADEERKAFAAEREAFNRERLTHETTSLLAESGLPASLAVQLTGADKDASAKNVATFKTAFDAAVQEAVEKRLAGKPPAAGGAAGGTSGVEAAFIARNPGLKF